jgi:glycosyltransferase involved in cell wall biosynthesis
LFEYLAAGRAIISSDLPVLQEILDPDNSIILPAKDTDAWVMAIRDLQNDPKRRETLAVRAVQLAKNFSWEARAEQILK